MAFAIQLRSVRTILTLVAAALLSFGVALPAQAGVTISFWSHEFGNDFPHTFFVLEGTPDAGGPPVQATYGFTAKAVTPAILMGSVPGRIDEAKHGYVLGSDVHFSVLLTDAQYADILRLVEEWGENGDHHYNLNRRNCVHFVAEAARRSGLTVVEDRKLMKKPRSFVDSVEAANAGRIRLLNVDGKAFYAMADRTQAPVHSDAVAEPAPQPAVPPVPAAPVVAAPVPQ